MAASVSIWIFAASGRLAPSPGGRMPRQPEKRAMASSREQRFERSALQLQCDVGMSAARIMRIRRADDANQVAMPIIADRHLAMIGFEIHQPRPGTQRHPRRALIQRIR